MSNSTLFEINITFIPRDARLISLSPRAELSRANTSEKIYLYISLKMSAMLPSNSEKQSMNDVRQSFCYSCYYFALV